MQRVVVLSAFLRPFRSGAEACAEEVSTRLQGEFEVRIVTARLRRDLPKEDMVDGVPVTRVGLGFSADKYLFPLLAPFAAQRLKPDLIHAVLESYAGLAMIGCSWLLPRVPRLLTCQSTNTALLVGAMHRAATRLTVISRALVLFLQYQLRHQMRFGSKPCGFVALPTPLRHERLIATPFACGFLFGHRFGIKLWKPFLNHSRD